MASAVLRMMVNPSLPTPLAEPGFVLSAAIACVLVLASLVGAGLKILVARGAPHGGIDNLNARVRAWWLIAAVTGAALALGYPGVTLLFAIASFVALREFVPAADSTAVERCWRLLVFLLLPVQYLLLLSAPSTVYTTTIPVLVVVATAAIGLLATRPSVALRAAGVALGGAILCVYCLSHVPALFALDIPGYARGNVFLVVYLVVVVQASDVLQYVWGKLAGRRRIAPRISPEKTVAGTVGGVLTATALGMSLAWITPFSLFEAAAISLALTSLGFAGGLLLSAIKRARGIKDWGTLIEGHGGVLDRLDSLCLSAPCFFHVLRVGWST